MFEKKRDEKFQDDLKELIKAFCELQTPEARDFVIKCVMAIAMKEFDGKSA